MWDCVHAAILHALQFWTWYNLLFLHGLYQFTDHAFDSMSGSFMTGNVSVCHMLTVIDNNVAEPDGTLVVTISNSSLMPANTLLNERQSTITIISDDSECKEYCTVVYMHMIV